jgi:hypothetical protein
MRQIHLPVESLKAIAEDEIYKILRQFLLCSYAWYYLSFHSSAFFAQCT